MDQIRQLIGRLKVIFQGRTCGWRILPPFDCGFTVVSAVKNAPLPSTRCSIADKHVTGQDGMLDL